MIDHDLIRNHFIQHHGKSIGTSWYNIIFCCLPDTLSFCSTQLSLSLAKSHAGTWHPFGYDERKWPWKEVSTLCGRQCKYWAYCSTNTLVQRSRCPTKGRTLCIPSKVSTLQSSPWTSRFCFAWNTLPPIFNPAVWPMEIKLCGEPPRTPCCHGWFSPEIERFFQPKIVVFEQFLGFIKPLHASCWKRYDSIQDDTRCFLVRVWCMTMYVCLLFLLTLLCGGWIFGRFNGN